MPRITSVKQQQLTATAPDQTLESSQGRLLNTVQGRVQINNPRHRDTTGRQNDQYGWDVDIDGDYYIVCTPYETGVYGYAGRVYIHSTSDGSLLHTLGDEDVPASNLYFGQGIRIHGQYCVVSVEAQNSAYASVNVYDVSTAALRATIARKTSSGAVDIDINHVIIGSGNTNVAWIYTLDGTLVREITNPEAAANQFGRSVAISGDRCVIGAYLDDVLAQDSGRAYVYSVSTGQLLYTLENPNAYDTAVSDQFGYKVDIDGDLCIVTAFGEDDASGTTSGKVYVFDLTTGDRLYTLDNPNPTGTSANDYFGFSVRLRGDRAIVGAYRENNFSGYAYIYDMADGSLLYSVNNPTRVGAGNGDQFGYSVGTDGTRYIVGANAEDYTNADGTTSLSAGQIYVFDSTATLLLQPEPISDYGSSTNEFFSDAAALRGNRVAIGAYGETLGGSSVVNSGIVQMLDPTSGTSVTVIENPDFTTITATSGMEDRFGSSVALTDTTLLVGAPYERLNASPSITEVGRVYAFSSTDGSALYSIENPGSIRTIGDRFGSKVAADGDYFVVSSPYNDATPAPCLNLDWWNSAVDNGWYGSSSSFAGYAGIFALLEQPDGKILAGGAVSSTSGSLTVTFAGVNSGVNSLKRFNANGTVDNSFSLPGTGFGTSTGVRSMALQSDGRIVAGGNFTTLNGNTRNRLVRLNADGTEDTTFATNIGTGFDNFVWGTAIQSDGKILVVGQFTTFNGNTRNRIVRLNSDGTEDTTFATNIGTGFDDIAYKVIQLSSGKIAVVGNFTTFSGTASACVCVLNADGTLDSTFNANAGSAFTLDSSGFLGQRGGTAVAQRTDGKIVVGGMFSGAYGFSNKIVIINTDGTLDSSLSSLFRITDLKLDSADNIYVCYYTQYQRIFADGTLDTTSNVASGTITNGQFFQSVILPVSDGDMLVGGSWPYSIEMTVPTFLMKLTPPYNDTGILSGLAFICNVSDGSVAHTLTSPNPDDLSISDLFGSSVDIRGNLCVVGSPGEYANRGRAFVYDVTSGALVRTLEHTSLTSAKFGTSVSISDSYIAVGAPDHSDSGSQPYSGRTYVFDAASGALLHTLTNPNTYGTVSYDRFGNTVSINENFCVVGALNEDSGAGAVYVFASDSGRLVYTMKNPSQLITKIFDVFGISVSIDKDNDRLVIGSRISDEHGQRAGKAFIYNLRPSLPATTCAVASAADNVDEGADLTINVTTTNTSNGTVLRWRILDRPEDFLVNTGTVTVASNAASFTVTPTADLLTEGAETFRVQLEKLTGTVIAVSDPITINDTSLSP